MTSSTQPGWYDDSDDTGAQRYWDGQTWTPHRRRKPRSAPAPASPPAAPSEFSGPGQQSSAAPWGQQTPEYAAQQSTYPGVTIESLPAPQQPPSWAPPQNAGQYSQPTPGQWVPPSPATPAVPAKAGGSGLKVVLIVAAVVAVIGGLVAALWLSGVFNRETKKLAIAGIQTEVQKILVDRVTGYTSSDIKNVTCNNGQDPTVKQGGNFTCNVTDRGKQHQLTVTFIDGNGTYEVGLPQLSGGK